MSQSRPLSPPEPRAHLTLRQLADAKNDLIEEVLRGEYAGMRLDDLLDGRSSREMVPFLILVCNASPRSDAQVEAVGALRDYLRAVAAAFFDSQEWRVEMRAAEELQGRAE